MNLIRSLSVSRGILLITHDQAVAAIADTIVALDREKDQNSLPT